MSNEQKFPHLDKNVLKTYQLRESLIPPINWGSTQETDQLNILSKQHFCQMGLELRPNLKLPMHTSLFCFEGQRPLVERAGLHIGKSFHILSHLKTNWSDSLSIFSLFSYYGTCIFFLLICRNPSKKIHFANLACKGWNPTRRGKTGGLWNGELILKRFR